MLDRSLACVTCACSTARSRVTCECWKLESSAHGPRPSARRGKLIRTSLAGPARVIIARALTVLLWPSEPPCFLFRCSWIRTLFSEPPRFFSEPAPRYLLRAPCSRPPRRRARALLRAPCSLLSSSEPRTRGALASYSARTRESERSHSRNTRVCERSHSRTLACESHLTRE